MTEVFETSAGVEALRFTVTFFPMVRIFFVLFMFFVNGGQQHHDRVDGISNEII